MLAKAIGGGFYMALEHALGKTKYNSVIGFLKEGTKEFVLFLISKRKKD